jgi:hypothetical protein
MFRKAHPHGPALDDGFLRSQPEQPTGTLRLLFQLSLTAGHIHRQHGKCAYDGNYEYYDQNLEQRKTALSGRIGLPS